MGASARTSCVVALALLLTACPEAHVPTSLAVPNGAIDLKQFIFLEGRAYQTDFTLKIAYPATPALEHYLKAIPKPWVRCAWSGPDWESHLDGTEGPTRTVHQQLHMWINRDARRTLMVATRYISPGDCAPQPLNDEQRIVVVEYFGVDVDDTISALKLTCPGPEVRSNSTPHADARQKSCKGDSPSPRAGGRER